MSAGEIVEQLRSLGSDAYKHALRNHNIPEPFFGVKIEELKKIQSKVKKDYQLALDLYDTGIYDAMYLAGLIADDARMTKEDLRRWLAGANCHVHCVYTVPWVASEGLHGKELALEWIESCDESAMTAGWATLSSLVSVKDNSDLDLTLLKGLLDRVESSIHQQPNWVRSVMNGFVIALGSYVSPLSDDAVRAGTRIGPVTVDMGATACKVPFAPDQIERAKKRGSLGKKRKTAKC